LINEIPLDLQSTRLFETTRAHFVFDVIIRRFRM